MKRFDLVCRIIGGLGIAMALILIIFALFNSMVADDYAYFSYLQDGGLSGFFQWHFFEHSGRLLQGVVVAFGWIIGGAASVKFMPILVLAGLIAAMSWAVWRFLPLREKSKLYSVGIGAALASMVVLLMPSLFDTYLWWTSNSVHLLGVTILVLACCFADVLIREKLEAWKQVLILIALFLGQICSENVAVLTVAVAGLAMTYCWAKKLKQRKIVTVIFGVLLLGLLVLYFSPGSVARRGNEMGLGFDFMRVFVESVRHLKVFVVTVQLWQITLVAAVGILLSFVVMKPSVKLRRKIVLWTILATGFALYISLVMFGYIGHGMNFRSFTAPSMILTLGSTVVLAFGLARMRVAWRQFLVVMCLVVAIVGMIKFSVPHIAFLAARQDAEAARDVAVRKQVASKSSEVIITELPILIDNSEAVDISANIAGRNMWFEKYFRRYYHISDGVYLPVLAMPEDYRALWRSGFNFLNEPLERLQGDS